MYHTPGYLGGLGTLADVGHPSSFPAHYGEDIEDAGEAGSQDLPSEVTQAIEVVAATIGAQANTPEELRARIANLQVMKTRMPALTTLYDNRIRRLQGRLDAMVREERETTSWRMLGQTGIGVGILTGFALLGLIIVTAQRQRG